MRNFEDLFRIARDIETQTVAVAQAADDDVLKALREATDKNIVKPILFGDRTAIEQTASEAGISLEGFEICHVANPSMVGLEAVQAVKSGRAGIFMKGLISTKDFLRAVLNKESGIPSGNLLSHVAVIGSAMYDRLILLTDAAMNITPTLDEKSGIINNAVECARTLGVEKPRVAMVCAVETVNPKMQCTMDAAVLSKMSDRGQFRGCIIDGPLGLDNAVSLKAAEHKGIVSEVAGRADILVVPDIQAGNVGYKTLTYFSEAKIAAVIMGATAPVVLTSRADSAETKLYSLCLGAVMAHRARQ
ncbi:MAG: phosphate butyryltransferase [Candidatus Wallbacteria bacterium HGW-Wallbacteria-1]|uniref:Phosphate butyryltransferase n=1 Tax=Candidatus Wallbacteria bacterium HGW-Wallbacteria-1 TaxID=2013854 RepID=A0A2N1PKN8_9BACT|nr:MAG: phosphate butyryltransferase [Candidatus Wallbacteria bacterium HGW-Wallbacteria-1]